MTVSDGDSADGFDEGQSSAVPTSDYALPAVFRQFRQQLRQFRQTAERRTSDSDASQFTA